VFLKCAIWKRTVETSLSQKTTRKNTLNWYAKRRWLRLFENRLKVSSMDSMKSFLRDWSPYLMNKNWSYLYPDCQTLILMTWRPIRSTINITRVHYRYAAVFRIEIAVCSHRQGCKLLSDIGQCPTKFDKCPSKSNFDRTLVRSQKKNCHIIHFFAVTKSDCKFTQYSLNLHFAIKFTRHSSILLNVAPEWLYILVSWLIYFLLRIYMSDRI
jgi:hypothetical protein